MRDVVKIENLSYFYPYSEVAVLDHINLSIKEGEIVVLTGPTGSGKTTLCLTLNGVIPHILGGKLDGRVLVDGMDVLEHDVAELSTKVGIVFQSPDVQLFSSSVISEIAFGPENLAIPREEIRERVSWAMELTGLKGYEERSPAKLSDGEKRKVAIASILAMRPKIIVLDEPTTGLDSIEAKRVISLIESLRNKYRTTFLIVEHREHILRLADRILLMVDGKILGECKPRDLFDDEKLMNSAYIRVPEVVKLFHLLRKEGIYRGRIPLTVEEALPVISRVPIAPSTVKSCNAPKDPRANEELIRMEGVSCGYGKQEVIKEVNVKINKGEFLALVGRNGAGKTTLAKCMVGLIKPSNGRILLQGRDIRDMNIADISPIISYIFQNPERQFFSMSVEEEVSFGPRNLGLSEEEINERVEESLRSVNLIHLKEKHPRSLSRGQMQRLAIAIALAMRPQAIILDEPMTGQDEASLRSIEMILRKLREEGKTILLITHEMGLVSRLADRVIALANGRIVFDGPTRKFFWDERAVIEAGIGFPPLVQLLRNLPDPSRFEGIVTAEEFIEAIRGRGK